MSCFFNISKILLVYEQKMEDIEEMESFIISKNFIFIFTIRFSFHCKTAFLVNVLKVLVDSMSMTLSTISSRSFNLKI